MPIIQPGTTPRPRKASSPRLSRKAIDQIVANRSDEMIAECGCVTYPAHVAAIVDKGRKHVFCNTHGWQWSRRKATSREVLNNALGLPLDFTPDPLPDIPPF
jgi:hypothetical protein